jgi:hypothetical protein
MTITNFLEIQYKNISEVKSHLSTEWHKVNQIYLQILKILKIYFRIIKIIYQNIYF